MANVFNILDVPVGGATTFLALTDTPGSYVGAAGDVATVNGGESAIIFSTPAAAPVSSVFGRTGAVVAAADDYAATQLQDETDGVILTWDAAGEAVLVGPGTAGQVLTSNGAGAAPSFQDSAGATQAFSGRHTVAIINLGETYTDVDINAEDTKTANFTHAANSSDVTANFTGEIELSAHMLMEIDTASQDRSAYLIKFQVDTGGGFADVPGTEVSGYLRDNLAQTNNQTSIAIAPTIIAVTSGDIFKLQTRKDDGTNDGGDIDTVSARITLKQVNTP